MSYVLNKTKFLSDKEYLALTTLLTRCQDQFPRDVAILFTLLYTGARPGELLNTKVQDLHLEERSLFIQGLKGSRDREIPLPGWLFQQVKAQADGKAMTDPIFPLKVRSLQHIWHQYRAGSAASKGIRSLRHTFAIRLYQKTKDLKLVQLALGHKSIQNTMVYADYVYNQDQMRRLLL
jgi:integrase